MPQIWHSNFIERYLAARIATRDSGGHYFSCIPPVLFLSLECCRKPEKPGVPTAECPQVTLLVGRSITLDHTIVRTPSVCRMANLASDIDGVRTSRCNKAYLEFYPPANVTAKAIAHVVEEGVSIVGKTTLSSFLCREEATESIDYQIAWNSRADG